MSASAHSASSKSRIGIWEPLPAIIYAVVIHPLELLKNAEGYTIRPEDLGIDPPEHGDTNALQTLPEDLEPEDPVANPHLVPLEIGDEIYAFEKFVPDVRHGAEWYKGWALSALAMFGANDPIESVMSSRRHYRPQYRCVPLIPPRAFMGFLRLL